MPVLLVVVILGAVLSFVLKPGSVRTGVRVLTVTAAVLPISGFLLGAAFFGGLFDRTPPSLDQLASSFPVQRADLETILRMSTEDGRFTRIAPTFLDYRDAGGAWGTRYSEPSKDPSPLAAKRWDEYRRLYKQDRIDLGIQRDEIGDAFIMVASVGLLNRGHVTGYLFCRDQGSPESVASSFEPCRLPHQDSGAQKYSYEPRQDAYAFRRLDSRWFAFDLGPS